MPGRDSSSLTPIRVRWWDSARCPHRHRVPYLPLSTVASGRPRPLPRHHPPRCLVDLAFRPRHPWRPVDLVPPWRCLADLVRHPRHPAARISNRVPRSVAVAVPVPVVNLRAAERLRMPGCPSIFPRHPPRRVTTEARWSPPRLPLPLRLQIGRLRWLEQCCVPRADAVGYLVHPGLSAFLAMHGVSRKNRQRRILSGRSRLDEFCKKNANRLDRIS
jgi:hypothetical protein